MTTTKHQFHVVGMHCKSCVVLTETELGTHPEVRSVRANLTNCTIEVTGDFGNREREHLVSELSALIEKHGYSLALEKSHNESKWDGFKIALPAAFGILFLFFLLQKLGVVNLVNADSLGYGTAFLIGIVASLSTCMAVVGGLLLSMSASYAKEGHRMRPQIMFHMGRIISFFVLGGVIGAAGSAFSLSGTATLVLALIVGAVMLVMGLNLLDVFPWAKRLMPGMPKFLSRSALGASGLNHAIMPFLVGVATFFLPCGFTQAMQIYTLSTGGFVEGGATMLAFALGTLPVLALVSVSSFGIKNAAKRGVFFKTAGIIVIAFAVYNIYNSLAAAGLI
ncbi:MAG: hypothetical protein A3F53_00690 [Candidatus Zambryskibacteria bacterium RIFCSPHIGHO2_12_FULL_48_10]|uniref:HMA domain-containing protein n=1 Tax=Candidatus Zambryskibacteria bacterium RIFCSPHIGHO2_01_FULL_46_25 TaxID=1802738 RepID=A0A1G2T0C7_9BACT|nr:MAG: Heavy metal transport/detoxification protein [Parcubacteria group bacterium GW2011_GWA1_47_10]OHA90289.1 MAG: hypothetical protein A2838_01645 [Candidatus Zambryskibacteria bacterium RIFCSPHIGHO2_01_FULL_46_25]OHB01538.1 MAG: hypothetical protein A3F53_00690 [Candidatus Zambryskibacteria bacterium RIFCSPHIGHO2_12_FULL_48_10]OHB06828.1 MAG: hypothetical protein A3A31_00790 [Candidatus Zambryskibacteria bacterium RIFCSPLOWO2_01_FULL_48_25]